MGTQREKWVHRERKRERGGSGDTAQRENERGRVGTQRRGGLGGERKQHNIHFM